VAIPKYETVMLPWLQLLHDGSEHKFADLVPVLGSQFDLTSEELEQMLPSGRVTTFRSRVHWAATYMAQAGLIRRPQRGWLQLTDRGKDVLAGHPQSIDNGFLNRYPEFREFRARSSVKPENGGEVSQIVAPVGVELSPEESLEQSYRTLRLQLAGDLLEKLRTGSSGFFEQVVVDLLVAMGYGGSRPGVAEAIGKSGDGGIDGIIREDKLGLDVVCAQAKRWNGTVGRPEIQAFAGSLDGRKSRKGVFITTVRRSWTGIERKGRGAPTSRRLFTRTA
jgi:restriction system protein